MAREGRANPARQEGHPRQGRAVRLAWQGRGLREDLVMTQRPDDFAPYVRGVPSDMTEEALCFYASEFWKAHERAPGGMSLEIGTREGGSAVVALRILDELYALDRRPMLITVDPYGNRPYAG